MNPRPAWSRPDSSRPAAADRASRTDRTSRADRTRTFPPLPARPGARGLFAESWWGSAWLDALETTALDSARLARGRTYARDGHVDTITVTPGRVIATVRGSRPRPYLAEVRLRTLTDQEWHSLLDAVAAEPGRLAALLAKKLPLALAEREERLLPGPGDLVPRCSCPDDGRPCKHAAALCFQVARLLDADPFVLLLMRGRGERELLDELSRRNAALTAREARGYPHTATPPATAGRGSGEPEGTPATRGTAHTAAGEAAAAPGEPTAPGTPTPPGVLARTALADRSRPSLPPPLPVPPHPGRPPALPDGDGLPFDPATLELLAADAAARAHACVSAAAPPPPGGGPPDRPSLFPDLPPREDAIRLAATAHPTAGLTSATRALYRDLAAATGRTATDVARSVAAWRQGGPEGLALLETTWNPPAGDFDRARSALLAADLPALRPHRNHLTDPGRGVQLRFGHDHRWYPYESEPGAGDWWPAGPADADPVGALTTLLAR
ncbi:zinc finger protein [Streptomyces sp. NBRC 110611]|uniref:SWIM zinc finger family protein n=1 Tax=Streptomyces sp. NBRC 110611 TaxID=1621259 RepID=UPI00083107A9|nr:SWIM zinc finger family protein [Streptomyces sp. NBRC 110611]GAU68366.1 zinc finger protein [Streptomyces sp. NBRC 110611]